MFLSFRHMLCLGWTGLKAQRLFTHVEPLLRNLCSLDWKVSYNMQTWKLFWYYLTCSNDAQQDFKANSFLAIYRLKKTYIYSFTNLWPFKLLALIYFMCDLLHNPEHLGTFRGAFSRGTVRLWGSNQEISLWLSVRDLTFTRFWLLGPTNATLRSLTENSFLSLS